MPYDSTGFVPTVRKIATPAEFWAASPAERCDMLADLLESPKLPLRWDFENIEISNDCGTAGCALGSARAVWAGYFHDTNGLMLGDVPAAAFGLNWTNASALFGLPGGYFRSLYNVEDHTEVTPGMVAAELRKHGTRPAAE